LKTLGATEKKLKNDRKTSKKEKKNKKHTFKRHRAIDKKVKNTTMEKRTQTG
jgi:hypothetical protein